MKNVAYPANPVLIIDDEPNAVQGCRFLLESAGIDNVQTITDPTRVLDVLKNNTFCVILLDLLMPDVTGEDLLTYLSEHYPQIPVIVITGISEIEQAAQCMKLGAFDLMAKPVTEGRLISGVKRAIEHDERRRNHWDFRDKVLGDKLEHPEAFAEIITCNHHMRNIFQYVEVIARTCRPVLITGETGVGKEEFARVVHRLSGCKGELVSVNVAGLDEAMFSDVLFGHRKGAFTDAFQERTGLIRRADRGTLFLDEIGDLSPANQAKLLRMIQENEFFPVGSDVPVEVTARLIVATNKDLEVAQSKGEFRRDLFYRLRTHHIHIPPLRERISDLPLLLEHFTRISAEQLGISVPVVPGSVSALLAHYSFPGNIRELQGMVFDATSRCTDSVLSVQVFRDAIQSGGNSLPANSQLTSSGEDRPFRNFEALPTLKEASRLLLLEALVRASGNQGVAAGMLGISRTGLNKALKRSGILRY
jgi:DNA-binding NtrC family response regulator